MSAKKSQSGRSASSSAKTRGPATARGTLVGVAEPTPATIIGPFNLREYLLLGMGVLFILNSFLPILSVSGSGITVGYNAWTAPGMQIVLIAIFAVFPAITSVLIALRRLMPETHWRVGSLSIDQYASVASVVLSITYLTTMFLLTISLPAATLTTTGAGLFSGLGLSLISVALTTGAYRIPFFRGEFISRAEAPAHPMARPAMRVGVGTTTGSLDFELPSAGPSPTAPRTDTGSSGGLDPASAEQDGSIPEDSIVDAPGVVEPAASEALSEHPDGFDGYLVSAPPIDEVRQFGDSDKSVEDIPPAPLSPGVLPEADPASTDSINPANLGIGLGSLAGVDRGEIPGVADGPIEIDSRQLGGGEAEGVATAPNDLLAAEGAFEATPEDVVIAEVVYDSFWIAVPDARDVIDEATGGLVFVATPGVWILAVEDRGHALLLRHEDGREGLLRDVTGVHRA
ncbi:hypothetical protein GCM10022198_24160 [Klugiella xanthotipulae]|uniref:Uncharacterized protein n=1 Tax=Klugiella xanthotipulae TaxID=244735 RepID=A0A543I6D8_9MICO|nr:hypothetical protein [Klugiella xanthotipulae]TQM66135.1 hypothetical protein FB466_0964 [Klugiella xanthotipulae]